jgi:hypothetical protein
MFGGMTNGHLVEHDLWMLETGGESVSCSAMVTRSKAPEPRVGHAGLLIGNAFVIFLGDTKNMTRIL